MLKRRGNRRFHVLSTWNTGGVFVGKRDIRSKFYKMAKRNKGKNNDKQTNGADEGSMIIVD